ncbi:MAG: hypothetical protein ACRDHD_09975 [Candidatus Limnocylindria bacterium]
MTPAAERLAHQLLDRSPDDPLTDELAHWLASSSRFRAFVEAHRDKIRKKLRGAADAEARRDVRAELRVAHLLLADRRIGLAFEAYGSARGGPDFTVSVGGERPLNLEVTRLHRAPNAASHGGQLLAKLRQLPPGAPNAVLVAVEGDRAQAFDVTTATRALRTRADAKEEAFFASRGFAGTRDFYDRYLRLGAVLVWAESAAGDARATIWHNRSARIAVPERAARACLASLRAG